MIVNPEILEKIKDVIKVKIKVGKYMIEKYNIAPLSYDKKYYYFSDNEDTQYALKHTPLILKIF